MRSNSFLTPQKTISFLQKTTMRPPPTTFPLEWLKLKEQIIKSVCKHGKKLEFAWIFNGNVYWYNHFGKLVVSTEYINPKS